MSAFGCLLLSAVYIMPELGLKYAFYPRPWISTVLFGALFVYIAMDTWPQQFGRERKIAAAVAYGLMLFVIAAAWAVPGLLLALIVVMLGAASGNRVFVGAGIAFLVIFLGAYFYGLQVTMPVKSATLVATGAVTLVARWLILHVMPAPGEPGHV